jgi:membrane protease subunit HflK
MFDRLIEFLISIIELFFFTTVVDVYERAVVLRFGKAARVLNPGIHFIWPFGVEEVMKDNVVPSTAQLRPQAITTKDGKGVVVTAIVTWAIKDIKTFLCEIENAEGVLADASRGALRQTIASKTWEEIARAGGALDQELTRAVREPAKRWGIKVIKVTLADVAQARCVRVINDAFIFGGE